MVAIVDVTLDSDRFGAQLPGDRSGDIGAGRGLLRSAEMVHCGCWYFPLYAVGTSMLKPQLSWPLVSLLPIAAISGTLGQALSKPSLRVR